MDSNQALKCLSMISLLSSPFLEETLASCKPAGRKGHPGQAVLGGLGSQHGILHEETASRSTTSRRRSKSVHPGRPIGPASPSPPLALLVYETLAEIPLRRRVFAYQSGRLATACILASPPSTWSCEHGIPCMLSVLVSAASQLRYDFERVSSVQSFLFALA